jgi:hypothetical protein
MEQFFVRNKYSQEQRKRVENALEYQKAFQKKKIGEATNIATNIIEGNIHSNDEKDDKTISDLTKI